jgi:tetratricopeptide (TPR) repeat protein
MVDIFLRKPLETKRKEILERVISAKEAAIPKPARKALERAQKYRAEKKLDAALTEIDKAIAIYPLYHRAVAERGIIQVNLGRLREALKDFSKSIEIFPEYEPAVSGAGYCLLSLEQYEDAIAYLGKAIQLNPDNTKNMIFLGIANLAMSRWHQAEEILERALKLDGSAAVEAHVYLADALAGQQLYSRAADALGAYLKLNPNAPTAVRLREREKYFRAQQSKGP